MIDRKRINEFINLAKNEKPECLNVDQKEWEDALEGYQETFSNVIDDETTTDRLKTLILFSALAFCKGVERAEVRAGLKKESNCPRY